MRTLFRSHLNSPIRKSALKTEFSRIRLQNFEHRIKTMSGIENFADNQIHFQYQEMPQGYCHPTPPYLENKSHSFMKVGLRAVKNAGPTFASTLYIE